jgi:heme/copper-type cytochrome/quinol oxidase subunit 2
MRALVLYAAKHQGHSAFRSRVVVVVIVVIIIVVVIIVIVVVVAKGPWKRQRDLDMGGRTHSCNSSTTSQIAPSGHAGIGSLCGQATRL